MSFFEQFPQISYDVQDNNIITNRYDIFRHVDVTDLRSDDYTTYLYYNIEEGDRPDIISQKLYNTPRYYWTFFIINDFLQAGYNQFYKSYTSFMRGLDVEYGEAGAIIFTPNGFNNILGGIDVRYSELRFVKSNESPLNTSTIQKWDPYMLSMILDGSEVDFYDDNATYHFGFSSDANDQDKNRWLEGYTAQLKDIGRVAVDASTLIESDLSTYTYTPTKTYSNLLLAPYRFRATFLDQSPLPDYRGTVDNGDLIGAYDALVNGYGSLTSDNQTYFEWEVERNEINRQIRYVRPEFISQFVDEYKRLINL
tara:strand:+ start:407 stop:1336 length:930 start_codon:yes stop_codon:yes gene_type:complete